MTMNCCTHRSNIKHKATSEITKAKICNAVVQYSMLFVLVPMLVLLVLMTVGFLLLLLVTSAGGWHYFTHFGLLVISFLFLSFISSVFGLLACLWFRSRQMKTLPIIAVHAVRWSSEQQQQTSDQLQLGSSRPTVGRDRHLWHYSSNSVENLFATETRPKDERSRGRKRTMKSPKVVWAKVEA